MAIKEVAASLDDIRQALKRAKDERPAKANSLRDVIKSLHDDIEALRRDRWAYRDIAEVLTKRGVNISTGTLEQYHRENLRANGVSAGARTKRERKAGANTAPKAADKPSAVKAEPASKPVTKPATEPKSEATPKTTGTKPPMAHTRVMNDEG